jgi:hypothetical protein
VSDEDDERTVLSRGPAAPSDDLDEETTVSSRTEELDDATRVSPREQQPDEATRLSQRHDPVDDATRVSERSTPVDDATRVSARSTPLDDATRVSTRAAEADDRTRVSRGATPVDDATVVRREPADDRTAIVDRSSTPVRSRASAPGRLSGGRVAFVPSGEPVKYAVKDDSRAAPDIVRTVIPAPAPSAPSRQARSTTVIESAMRSRRRRGGLGIVAAVVGAVIVTAVVIAVVVSVLFRA